MDGPSLHSLYFVFSKRALADAQHNNQQTEAQLDVDAGNTRTLVCRQAGRQAGSRRRQAADSDGGDLELIPRLGQSLATSTSPSHPRAAGRLASRKCERA